VLTVLLFLQMILLADLSPLVWPSLLDLFLLLLLLLLR
jgi:hypothetical protein